MSFSPPRKTVSFDEQMAKSVAELLDQYAKLKKDESKITGGVNYDMYFPEPPESESKQVKPSKKVAKIPTESEVKEANNLLLRLTAKMIVTRNAIEAIREFQSSIEVNKLQTLKGKMSEIERVSGKIPHSSVRASVAGFFGISVDSGTSGVIKKICAAIEKESTPKQIFSPRNRQGSSD